MHIFEIPSSNKGIKNVFKYTRKTFCVNFNTRNPLCAGSLKGCKLQSCIFISIYNHICLTISWFNKRKFPSFIGRKCTLVQFVMLCERSALFLDFLSAVSFFIIEYVLVLDQKKSVQCLDSAFWDHVWNYKLGLVLKTSTLFLKKDIDRNCRKLIPLISVCENKT